MKKTIVLALATALAACSPPAATTTSTEAAAPTGLMAEAQAKAPEEMPVFGYQLLAAYQTAHPEVTPVCRTVRRAESSGVVPPDVDPASVYGAHAGALVLSVQCGAQLTQTRMDPKEHWLVILAPGATEAVVVNCADRDGVDTCPRAIPRLATPATTTATTTATTH